MCSRSMGVLEINVCVCVCACVCAARVFSRAACFLFFCLPLFLSESSLFLFG